MKFLSQAAALALMVLSFTQATNVNAQEVHIPEICEFEQPENHNNLFNVTSPIILYGVVRIASDDANMPAGTPVSEWVDTNVGILCHVDGTYDFQADIYAADQMPVVVDGQSYVAGSLAGAHVGSIMKATLPDGTVLHASSAGVIGRVTLPIGTSVIRVSTRLVSMGRATPIPEGIIDLGFNNAHQMKINDAYDSQFVADPVPMFTRMKPMATVIFQANSCTPANIPSLVDIGSFSSAEAPGIGNAWQNEKEFGFTLTCPANVSAYAVFTDATNQGNLTDSLTLTGGDIPSGVALKLYSDQGNGSPISFGPEDIAQDNPGRFKLLDSGASGVTDEPVTFRAKLIQEAATIEDGIIEAKALVTLSYD
ncbi:hypothetical protein DBR33_06895 [Stenotrophomonas sp. HMWF022]|uniref:fimbrial protein n=1 Tax=Stenotrophomonas sp. HMWF023 TaxID=2056859 RepID=UPI000D3A89B4|nr:fimbrial protein [Stenotrophomonas sp. HMWF023]PTS79809.1 hypothetical protein DBR20_02910 [Stenotrophomonas sp. HMWF023]PTT50388.1 hypothetical protein DBR33_06895 [Stenotrophomonas sp. HMWF022]